MQFLKEIFGERSMTYCELEAALNRSHIKLANLSDGGYVSKNKYDDRMKRLKEKIAALTLQLERMDSEMNSAPPEIIIVKRGRPYDNFRVR